MPPIRLLPLAEALDRLDPRSGLAQRAPRDDDYASAWALLVEGDLELHTLRLDFWMPLFDAQPAVAEVDDERWIVALIVTGDVRVHGPVYSRETDGAPDLHVLGDLHAGHMLVGGQEVHVSGDLQVDGLLWGDYNHGELHVQGDLRANVTAFTSEYRVKVSGRRQVAHPLNDDTPGAYADLAPASVRAHLPVDCYEESDEDETEDLYLCAGALLERLAQGRPILDVDLAPAPPADPPAPFLFGDGAFAATTLAPLPSLPFLPAQADEDHLRIAFVHDDDTRISVLCYGPQANDGVQDIVLLQPEGQRHWVFCSAPPKPAGGLLGRLFGGGPHGPVFSVEYLEPGSEDWTTYDDSAPASIREDARRQFAQALETISEYVHLRSLLDPALVENLLALPIVQPYDDWWDVDRNGFWLAELRCTFRQEGAVHDGERYGAVLQLSLETAEDVFDSYRWHVVEDDAGGRQLELWYSPDNNNDDLDHIEVTRHLQHLRAGRARLLRAADLLQRAQRRLVGGRVPSQLDEDDAFAIRAWHAMGYPVALPEAD